MSQSPSNPPPLSNATPTISGTKKSERSWVKWVVIFGLLLIVGPCLLLSSRNPSSGATPIPLSEFRRVLLAGGIMNVSIDGDSLFGDLKGPTPITGPGGSVNVTKFQTDLPAGTCNWQFVQWILENAGPARVDVVVANNFVMQMVVPLIPWIVIFAFVAYFLRRSATAAKALRTQPTRVIIVKEESAQ